MWIRGAITAEYNTKEEILEKTETLLNQMIQVNHLKPEEIVSILFTATKDLDQAYPAVAARKMGITEAALLCFQEMYVENSLSMCIRVCIVTQSDQNQKQANHVYLEKAVQLRPDLCPKKA